MRRFRLTALAAVVLMLASCASPQSPKAASASLFYAQGGSIYVSDLTGTPPRKLTSGPGDTQPAPSPDGKRVAYVHRSSPDRPGGELWVLDLASGERRRLVDPAALVPKFDGEEPGVENPRWSPTGERIAFLKATFGGGGFLLTATADSGVVVAPAKPLFAAFDYSWSPDGSRIVWVGGRSDVRPVDVGVLTVGGSSTSVATDTNALSVSFDRDGRSVLFTNGDATGDVFAAIPFALRAGGIYAVDPGASPAPLLSGPGYYGDVAALQSGEIGYTEARDQKPAKAVLVLGGDRKTRTVGDTPVDAPAPVWAPDGSVAYIGDSAQRPLLIRQPNGDPRQIASGVEAFAWSG